MKFVLDKNRALSPQICEHICLQIALGEYMPDSKIASVREAALDFSVNPNTVQRSYETLEVQGILYSVRGSGWYVASDISIAKQMLEVVLEEKTAQYFESMAALGYTVEDVKSYVKEWKA
ncbi:MAG: GntR family transcriptional regulator [Clostridia bacterium]|nr:GntR family transcriptional regulator [Clostridia bacterium]